MNRLFVRNQNKKKSHRPSRLKNSRPRDDTRRFQLDQALIYNRILTQLDTNGKRLTSIEKKFSFCCPA